MKKRFTVLALATLSLNAHAGFLDGLNQILNTTGAILNNASGTSQNSPTMQSQSGSPDAFGDAQQAIPTIKKYNIPNKETKEYRIEDLIVEVKDPGYSKNPPVFITGRFYNKTNKPINVKLTFPIYDKEGFSQSSISTLLHAEANEKIKIKDLNSLALNMDSVIAVEKMQYENCSLTNKFGVCF